MAGTKIRCYLSGNGAGPVDVVLAWLDRQAKPVRARFSERFYALEDIPVSQWREQLHVSDMPEECTGLVMVKFTMSSGVTYWAFGFFDPGIFTILSCHCEKDNGYTREEACRIALARKAEVRKYPEMRSCPHAF
jgi:hypothetical protein